MKVYNRGPNDLEERIEHLKKQKTTLQDTIDGYKMLIEEQKKEIWQLKQIKAENEQNKNLVEGYKKVIEDLSKNVR
jgi:chromosome segregation ATPase|tara:strand:- start:268 stop:495 length:228 start_codon:yes stop_codon:yes gene_type:complete